jgi:hypothetical protein
VYAKYRRVNNCSERQVGEDFYDATPHVLIAILFENFIIKAICSGK